MGELVHQHETGCFSLMEISQDALMKSFEVGSLADGRHDEGSCVSDHVGN